MKLSLITAGALLLVANLSGWVFGAATTEPLGAALSTAIVLGFAGAWLWLAAQRRSAQRAPAVRARHRAP